MRKWQKSKSILAEEKSAMYQFPSDMKAAYESSPLSFVYYQNIDGKAMPVLASDGFCHKIGLTHEQVLEWLATGMYERMHPDDVGMVWFLVHRQTESA